MHLDESYQNMSIRHEEAICEKIFTNRKSHLVSFEEISALDGISIALNVILLNGFECDTTEWPSIS